MHLHSYLRSATEIIQLYNGVIPLATWLKEHFKQNKKFGSRDRKVIASLCFCYYRLGSAFAQSSIGDRLLIAQFLCNTESIFIEELRSEWKIHLSSAMQEKLVFLGEKFNSIFPFNDQLSDRINTEQFNLSHLSQPDLFLRVRPGKKNEVLQKLKSTTVEYSVEENCIRLPNQTKVGELLEIDSEVVIQDKSSQHSLDALKLQNVNSKFQISSIWDCCAASGGKTILLHDHFPKAQFTVSDIRESILHNLKKRFSRAGVQQYQSFVADVSSPEFSLNKKFDIIICDAPCSGSGTWGRTPEQLKFFNEEKIDHYVKLQKAIAFNASKQLKKGGYFLYITCSVFKKENESVTEFIKMETPLELLQQEYYKGYNEKADTIYAALFSV